VPVGPGTSCSVNNNAQIVKAPPGTLLNVFGGDDTASASAEFQTVVNGDGTMFCAWPAKAGPKPPIKQPEPEEEPTVCPQGWTPTPIPGKCCPYKTYWNGARCTRDVEPPPPPPQIDCWNGWFQIGPKQTKSYIRRGYKVTTRRKWNQKIWCARKGTPPPPIDCWNGWFEIGAKQTKSYVRKGYKVRPHREGNQKIWCAQEGTPPPPIACPPPAIGKLPFCKCGPGYKGRWPKCREIEPDRPCKRGDVKCHCKLKGLPYNSRTGKCGSEPPPSCRSHDVKCQCKLKGLPYNRKTGKCGYDPSPPNPKKECLKKGWKWIGNRCVKPTSRKQTCLKKGWNWTGNRCVKPTSPKQTCLKKGWKWTNNRCVKPNASCRKGYVGTPPNCKKKSSGKCRKGYVGKPPNCRKLLKDCPKGYVGKPPNCKKLPPILKLKPCPKGYVGKPPNCKKLSLNRQIKKGARNKLSKLNSLKQRRR
jgi:hypothetical protein